MKYKFKKLKEAPTTEDFWYDLTDGGYINPEQFTDDPETLKAIKEAIKLLKKLQEMCDLA